ncbi:MAG TPA: hypothetical protein VM677_19470 [Actinokineospora sp.]|nr:hypothetical protein [Actinokineospora sp.]
MFAHDWGEDTFTAALDTYPAMGTFTFHGLDAVISVQAPSWLDTWHQTRTSVPGPIWW